MSKKIVFLLAVAFFGGYFLVSGRDLKPTMKFDSQEYDFGTIKEEDGKVFHVFEFVNTGDQPVIIKEVRSSCGCTSPNWSKQPVAPGKKGFIKVTFDPKRRPGPINKSITVVSNADPAVTVLKIRGSVIEREKTIEDLYPRKMSSLLLKTDQLAFTKVKNTEVKEVKLEVYNAGEDALTIGFGEVPPYLNIKMEPERLQPKQKGQIVASYDGRKKNDWGYVRGFVDVLINQKSHPSQKLTISANIVEDFSEAEKVNAPKVEFDNKVFDFGRLIQGEKTEHAFVMHNLGKSDLIIRKTRSSCGCTVIAPESEIIKPGEETKIKAVFNSKGKRGRQNKMITVITNDPSDPVVNLRITGNVVMPDTD